MQLINLLLQTNSMLKEELKKLLFTEPYLTYLKNPLGLTSREIMRIAKNFDFYDIMNRVSSISVIFKNSDKIKDLSESIGGYLYSSSGRGRAGGESSFSYEYGGKRIYYLTGDGSGRIIHEMLDMDSRNGKAVLNSAHLLKKLVLEPDSKFNVKTLINYKSEYQLHIPKLAKNNLIIIEEDGNVVPTDKGRFIFSQDVIERFKRLKAEKFRIDLFK